MSDNGDNYILSEKDVGFLSQLKNIKIFPEEKNLFTLGAKHYYERPESELFAFFLNPNEEHGIKDLFLKALCSALKIDCSEEADDITVSTEVHTGKGYIDILIVSENKVFCIENKMYAKNINPFDDYKHYVEKRFEGSKKEYHYVFLSIASSSTHNDFKTLLYSDYLVEITILFGEYFFRPNVEASSKWFTLLREFVLNIKNMTGEDKMDSESLKLFENYFEDITNVAVNYEDFLKAYLEKIGKEIKSKNPELLRDAKVWDDKEKDNDKCLSVLFIRFKYNHELNGKSTIPSTNDLKVRVYKDGKFKVTSELDSFDKEKLNELKNILNSNNYEIGCYNWDDPDEKVKKDYAVIEDKSFYDKDGLYKAAEKILKITSDIFTNNKNFFKDFTLDK